MTVIQFFIEHSAREEFQDKKILEVGSAYVNGSVRPLIERFGDPSEYVGTDLEPGKYVDVVLPVEKIVEYFGLESFDIVIGTEFLEHCRDWRSAIENLKRVLKPQGTVYLTTRSRGFPYHAYPHDFWRYEINDMKAIFGDFDIVALESDPHEPGVFLKASRPLNWKPGDLSHIELYSMILGRRTARSVPQTSPPLFRKVKMGVIPEMIYELQVLLWKLLR